MGCDLAAIVVGLLGGFVVGLGVSATWGAWSSPGGLATMFGTLTALLGAYLCLVLLVLVARVPWLEQEVGQDRLVRWHRKVAPWALLLILAHFVLTSVGYAQASSVSVGQEVVDLVMGYPWMVPAAAGMALMIFLALTSIAWLRHKIAYETWWAAHTYFYLAVVLAFGHQLTAGTLFTSHDLLRYFWITLYAVVAAAIVWGRIGLPLIRSFRHDLRVERVVQEAPGVVSVYISGRNLALLGAQGGQFFGWRFMTRHWWWQAHPYSLSAGANGSWLRITVKDLGDQSGSLMRLTPGTRVIAEGPYGAFTARARATGRIAAFAAGVGITPIRAILDDLPPGVKVTLIYRVADVEADNVTLRGEIEEIIERRGWRLEYLTGSRMDHPFSVDYLTRIVPDLEASDVYVCGPPGFADAVCAAARTAGVPPRRLHHEAFSF
ncbi:MAG: ferredoxin reductase family protein [Actinomycetes bacterium]